MSLEDDIEQGIREGRLARYEHEQFPAGTPVYIDESLRNLHPGAPLVGEAVACESIYIVSTEPYDHSRERLVPVKWDGPGGNRFIEVEYVRRREE